MPDARSVKSRKAQGFFDLVTDYSGVGLDVLGGAVMYLACLVVLILFIAVSSVAFPIGLVAVKVFGVDPNSRPQNMKLHFGPRRDPDDSEWC